MKPVDQTKMSPPDGDCFAACIASILELPLEEVPNYSQQGEWWNEWDEWLFSRGLYILEVKRGDDKDEEFVKGYHIITGKSHSGDWNHSVVGLNGKIVHDPNPKRRGLRNRIWYCLFVSLDPSQLSASTIT